MSPFRVPALLAAGFLLAGAALGQQASTATSTSSPTGAPIDAQAVPLIQNALGALNGVAAIKDVTLTGTVTRTVGPDTETGTITMKALGTNQSRLDMNLSGGTWSEVRGLDAKGVPQGSWVDTNGTTHKVAAHNTFTATAWFFPALLVVSQASKPNIEISYIGLETRDGVSVQHIHFVSPYVPRLASQKPPVALRTFLTELSAMDVYLDAVSYLPLAVTFNTHADKNANVNIPVEVDFSNYKTVNGVQVPFHIQRVVNGTPFDDTTIESAKVNSGLSAADFAVQ